MTAQAAKLSQLVADVLPSTTLENEKVKCSVKNIGGVVTRPTKMGGGFEECMRSKEVQLLKIKRRWKWE